jgi:hypothetical protein
MSTVLVVAVLAATAPVKVASPGLSGVGVSQELLTFVTEHLSQQLTFEGLEVFPPANIAAVLGLERQKELLGCGDASCMAELASALGVDAILVGNLAKLGEVYQLDARLVSATDGKVVALFSKRVQTDTQLLDAMHEAAVLMAPQLATKLGRTITPVARPARNTPPPPSAVTEWPAPAPIRYERRPNATRQVGQWILIGAGAIAAVGIVGFFIVADYSAPMGSPPTAEESAFGALFLSSLAVAAVGLVVYLVGDTERVPVRAALVPVPGGGVLSLGATF